MDVLASAFFVKVVVFLKPADPLQFRVLALVCKEDCKEDCKTRFTYEVNCELYLFILSLRVVHCYMRVAPANKLELDLNSLMIELKGL